jgi:alcohol dehydrogenase (cytochrome c)
LLFAGIAFGYGLVAGHQEIFPYGLIKRGVAKTDYFKYQFEQLTNRDDSAPSTAVHPLLTATAKTASNFDVLTQHPTTDWLTNGGNIYNQRYSPLTRIDRENVARLKGVWRTHLNGSGLGPQYSGEAQPIVHDGVIFVSTGESDVFALSIETGRILWTHDAALAPETVSVCCGWASRGVGIGEGKIFVGQVDGTILALNEKTGDVLWSVQGERARDGFSITSAPLYYRGLVITGFGGADHATRGRVKAYSADNGALVWTFYTIPGPGEPGHETWPSDTGASTFGGGTVWQTPAIDPELGLLYFQTANANPDLNGAARPGDNLFTVSVIALDVLTGKYRWHYQMVHHDLWDYDGTNPVILFDTEFDGLTRRGLAAAGKTGWVYILDRTNGEPLIGIEERPVPQDLRQATAATQPYPIGDSFVPQHIDVAPEGTKLVNEGRIFTPYWEPGPAFKPGTKGGANWPPSSYDPETQTMYICATDQASHVSADEQVELNPRPGVSRNGGTFSADTIALGVFAAIDLKSNKLVWSQHWPEECYSGSATTAGGLVFVGRGDGRFTALSSGDGALLWEFQTGAGVNAPPTVFEYAGEQYVVVLSAGNVLAGTPRGDSVWLFSLGGTLEPERPAVTGAQPMSFRVPDTEPDPALGRLVYAQTCIFCHGDNGQGAESGMPLAGATDLQAIRLTVFEGRRKMPPFGELLTAEQINDVAAYVAEQLPH